MAIKIAVIFKSHLTTLSNINGVCEFSSFDLSVCFTINKPYILTLTFEMVYKERDHGLNSWLDGLHYLYFLPGEALGTGRFSSAEAKRGLQYHWSGTDSQQPEFAKL